MGRSILVDGMDGSGKSTLVQSLAHELENLGKKVYVQEFPSKHGAIGKLIRESFANSGILDERALLPLFIADAYDYDQRLIDWGKDCDVLVLDRHPMVAAWAYQLDRHNIAEVVAMTSSVNFLFQPDATFIIDVPAEVAMERRGQRGGDANPMFEKDLIHTNDIRARYQSFSLLNIVNRPIGLLDGTLPTKEMVGGIVEFLNQLGDLE